MTDIYIYEPNFWWRADAKQVRKFVPVDPDVDEGLQRWGDRDEQRWNLVAQAVTQVSRALAAGEWELSDRDNYGLVGIDVEELTDSEKNIMEEWFGACQSVCMDPWSASLTDGRHRLWSTLDFLGSEPVPIKGYAISHAIPVNADSPGTNWQSYFVEGGQALEAVSWFDAADPVNVRFAHALKTAASGQFPARR